MEESELKAIEEKCDTYMPMFPGEERTYFEEFRGIVRRLLAEVRAIHVRRERVALAGECCGETPERLSFTPWMGATYQLMRYACLTCERSGPNRRDDTEAIRDWNAAVKLGPLLLKNCTCLQEPLANSGRGGNTYFFRCGKCNMNSGTRSNRWEAVDAWNELVERMEAKVLEDRLHQPRFAGQGRCECGRRISQDPRKIVPYTQCYLCRNYRLRRDPVISWTLCECGLRISGERVVAQTQCFQCRNPTG